MTAIDFKKIQSYTFFGALIGITVLFLWMLRPYVYPVFWAAVLAALFYPLYRRLLAKVKSPNVAAGLTELLILLIFIVPLAGIVSLLVQQAFSVYNTFGNRETFISFNNYLQQTLSNPLVAPYLEKIDLTDKLSSFGSSASAFLYSFLTRSGQNTARWIVQLLIMLYTLYFFLKDGQRFLQRVMHLLPLGDAYEQQLYQRFVSTTRATLKGTIVIGVVQGSIGTIALLVTGVPAAVFWGVIMIVLSIIPGIGASVVLLPTIVILLVLGQWWQAVVVLIALIMAGTIDNVLRGPLVGKDTQMHPLLIFFATLGGLLSFGISGVVIGPVITALLLSIWQIYEQKYHGDLVREG
ncbi:MAG: AI-2E family transporter [Candidatus Kerfeldbacteria bacterium]|nr:AI-2E family transporter [Candidatus Kerfeldbacteria bacterium]